MKNDIKRIVAKILLFVCVTAALFGCGFIIIYNEEYTNEPVFKDEDGNSDSFLCYSEGLRYYEFNVIRYTSSSYMSIYNEINDVLTYNKQKENDIKLNISNYANYSDMDEFDLKTGTISSDELSKNSGDYIDMQDITYEVIMARRGLISDTDSNVSKYKLRSNTKIVRISIDDYLRLEERYFNDAKFMNKDKVLFEDITNGIKWHNIGDKYVYIPVSKDYDAKTDSIELVNGLVYSSSDMIRFSIGNLTLKKYHIDELNRMLDHNTSVSIDIKEDGTDKLKNIYTSDTKKEQLDGYVVSIVFDNVNKKITINDNSKEYSAVYRELLENAYTNAYDDMFPSYKDEAIITINCKGDYRNSFDYAVWEFMNEFEDMYGFVIIMTVITGLMSIILFIYIIVIEGNDKSKCSVLENILDVIPLEIAVTALIFGWIFVGEIIFEAMASFLNSKPELAVGFGIVVYIVGYWSTEGLLYSLVRRLKKRTLLRSFLGVIFILWSVNTLQNLVRILGKKGRKRNEMLAMFAAYIILTGFFALIVIIGGADSSEGVTLFGLFALAILNVIAIKYVINRSKSINEIKNATDKIASGEYEAKIDTTDFNLLEQDIANNINSIGTDMNVAISQSIKDERLKVELITNVSHDIKTPLTSIINYVDLLRNDNLSDADKKHYLDILEKKSQRLRLLVEDLVEASKITSGNIVLDRKQIDFKELVNQSIGEFDEKFKEKNLLVNVEMCAAAAYIYADGRRTFRIVENLLQNVYKYSMPSTRVYIELKKMETMIILTIKNISAISLNIDPKELMERFKRGDESRTTEGSGLGLSIALNLAVLQDGTLDLDIDGDLFKAIVTFPECEPVATIRHDEAEIISFVTNPVIKQSIQEPLEINNDKIDEQITGIEEKKQQLVQTDGLNVIEVQTELLEQKNSIIESER